MLCRTNAASAFLGVDSSKLCAEEHDLRSVINPRRLSLAQSGRIHAQGLNLSKFGSVGPDNSDTFVSSPLEGGYSFFNVPPADLAKIPKSGCSAFPGSASLEFDRILWVRRVWVSLPYVCFT